jgi:hypothetical protein
MGFFLAGVSQQQFLTYTSRLQLVVADLKMWTISQIVYEACRKIFLKERHIKKMGVTYPLTQPLLLGSFPVSSIPDHRQTPKSTSVL